MDDFPSGTRSVFARSISAEVRAVMAARRITGRTLAKEAGFSSHNYLAIRLRDEKPFTLDDISAICRLLEEDGAEVFIARAYGNHMDHLWMESDAAWRSASESDPSTTSTADEYALAADDTPGKTEEQEADEFP